MIFVELGNQSASKVLFSPTLFNFYRKLLGEAIHWSWVRYISMLMVSSNGSSPWAEMEIFWKSRTSEII